MFTLQKKEKKIDNHSMSKRKGRKREREREREKERERVCPMCRFLVRGERERK